MKKALAILLALALVAGAVFAEEPAYDLSGSASLTWGIDLNTNAHGFTNDSSASLSFPLGATSGTAGEEPITGYIEISEFTVDIVDGAIDAENGSVTAKILFPSNLYLQIASEPSFEVANAVSLDAFYVDDGATSSADIASAEITSAGGFTFGLDGDLNFALLVGSTNHHTDAAGANSYMAGLNFGTKLGEMGTLDVNAILGSFDQAANMTIAAGLVLDLAPMDGLAVTLAADYVKATDLNLDASLAVGYEMADLVGIDLGAYFGLNGTNNVLDMMVRLNLLAVENLTFGAGVDLWDLTANSAANDTLIAAELAYKVAMEGDNHVSPYANVAYSLLSSGLYLNVGANMMFFPLTTFTIDYVAGSPTDDTVAIAPVLGATTDKGVITFMVEIAY